MELRSGFGSYICGEETALIESIEGKRGYPRLKPPFPGVSGLWGCPTVVNNVETLASVPAIINRGGAWYKSLGTADTPGTKIYQVIGQVQTPQIVEAPVGLTLRELIDTYGGGLLPGRSFKMCQTGGASARPGDRRSTWMSPWTSAPWPKPAAPWAPAPCWSWTIPPAWWISCRAVAVFFEHESCGQCTPCREGTPRLLQTITRICRGRGTG